MADNAYDEGAFLGLTRPHCDPGTARVVVVPAPYEATVSYGGGTADGPAALLEASRQVELYDRTFDAEPALRYGVFTAPAVPFNAGEAAETALARIAEHTERAAAGGRFSLVLGGEHAVSSGVLAGLSRARPGEKFDIVHLDAHADLRDAYEDNPHSHACAARRLLEHPACGRLWQLGIRSLCAEEAEFIREQRGRVRTWFAEDVHEPLQWWRYELADGVAGKKVFFTFDVDALDPSVVPGTGTPEPDGLAWRQVLAVANAVARTAEVVGMDAVETAPIAGLHYSEFNVAKLLYGLLNRFVRI